MENYALRFIVDPPFAVPPLAVPLSIKTNEYKEKTEAGKKGMTRSQFGTRFLFLLTLLQGGEVQWSNIHRF